MMQLKLALLACAVSTAAAAATNAAPLPTDEHGDYNAADIIEWIRSKDDGIIHESLRVGRERPGDPTSINGLFVKSDAKAIEEGEVIANIPWDCIISSGKKYSYRKFESCSAIYKLADELRKGEESTKAPYVRYLLNLPRGTMPGEWNDAEKEFLSKVLGNDELPPYEEDWRYGFERHWINDCEGDETDEMERAAYFLTQSRDEDTLMVPLYDMMNHNNDPMKLNTLSYKPRRAGDVFSVVASKKIEPGEQVYNSYNRCSKCAIEVYGVDPDNCETFSHYGTPDIFRIFGFIEDYPQSWKFETDDSSDDEMPNELDFCMMKDPDKDGEISVYWREEGVDDEDIAWIEKQLKRLRELLSQKDELEKEFVQSKEGEGDDKKIHRAQWETIWRYHGALVSALELSSEASWLDSSDDNDDENNSGKDEL